MPATYEPIQTYTLGSAATTIDFTSIPATYTDLRVVVVAKSTNSASIYLRFNSDSASNYSNTIIRGDGSTAYSNRLTSNTALFIAGYGIGITTQPGLGIADIFSYAGSTFKTVLGSESFDFNGTGEVANSVGLWRSTSAITSITVRGGTFDAGTTATLYGIKNF